MHVPHTQAITKFQTRQLSSYLCKAISSYTLHSHTTVCVGDRDISWINNDDDIRHCCTTTTLSFCNKM